MKHFRGKVVRIVGVSRGPSALNGLQFLEARREKFAQLLEISQGSAPIVQFVHQIDFGEKSDALVAEFRAVVQPLTQYATPRHSRLIHATTRPAFCGRLAAAQQALVFEALHRRIHLAEFGGPEVVDALSENSLQIVAAGGLAEQAEQDVIQAHVDTI